MANKVQFGLSNVYFALLQINEETGAITFGMPWKQSGAVNMTLDIAGSSTPFYADNIAYFTATSNAGYTGTLEMAIFDKKFRTDVLGDVLGSDNVMIENNTAQSKEVAMMYQIEGDEKAVRNLLYRVKFERSNETHATTADTVEPQTTTLNMTASAMPDTGNIKAATTEETAAALYDGWFNEVYVPTATPETPGA